MTKKKQETKVFGISDEEISLTNDELLGFERNPFFAELAQMRSLKGHQKVVLAEFLMVVTESVKFKALKQTVNDSIDKLKKEWREELIEGFKSEDESDKQAEKQFDDLDPERKDRLFNSYYNRKIDELGIDLGADSGFKLKKLIISESLIPDNINTAQLMAAMKYLILEE